MFSLVGINQDLSIKLYFLWKFQKDQIFNILVTNLFLLKDSLIIMINLSGQSDFEFNLYMKFLLKFHMPIEKNILLSSYLLWMNKYTIDP
jgi:hypothetical protein